MVLQVPLLLHVLHCAGKVQWSVMSEGDSMSLWWVMAWTETTAEFIHLVPGLHGPDPPGDCAQCPVPRALWPWATSAMEQVQPWGTADGSSQNRDWLGWGGRSDQRQGTLTQKCCLQLEPKLQRVQVLGLPKGALECNRAALSGDRGWKGTKCWWEAKGSPRFDVGEALLEAHDYGQQGFESPFWGQRSALCRHQYVLALSVTNPNESCCSNQNFGLHFVT